MADPILPYADDVLRDIGLEVPAAAASATTAPAPAAALPYADDILRDVGISVEPPAPTPEPQAPGLIARAGRAARRLLQPTATGTTAIEAAASPSELGTVEPPLMSVPSQAEVRAQPPGAAQPAIAGPAVVTPPVLGPPLSLGRRGPRIQEPAPPGVVALGERVAAGPKLTPEQAAEAVAATTPPPPIAAAAAPIVDAETRHAEDIARRAVAIAPLGGPIAPHLLHQVGRGLPASEVPALLDFIGDLNRRLDEIEREERHRTGALTPEQARAIERGEMPIRATEPGLFEGLRAEGAALRSEAEALLAERRVLDQDAHALRDRLAAGQAGRGDVVAFNDRVRALRDRAEAYRLRVDAHRATIEARGREAVAQGAERPQLPEQPESFRPTSRAVGAFEAAGPARREQERRGAAGRATSLGTALLGPLSAVREAGQDPTAWEALLRAEQALADSPMMRGVRRGLNTSTPGNVVRWALDKLGEETAYETAIDPPGIAEKVIASGTRLLADYGILRAGFQIGAAAARWLGTQTMRAAVAASFDDIAAQVTAGNLSRAEARVLAVQTMERALQVARSPAAQMFTEAGGFGGAVGLADLTGEVTRQLADEREWDFLETARAGATGAAAGAGMALFSPLPNEALRLLAYTGYWGAVVPLLREGEAPSVEGLLVAGVPMAVLYAAARMAAGQRVPINIRQPRARGESGVVIEAEPEARAQRGLPPAEPEAAGRAPATAAPAPPSPAPAPIDVPVPREAEAAIAQMRGQATPPSAPAADVAPLVAATERLREEVGRGRSTRVAVAEAERLLTGFFQAPREGPIPNEVGALAEQVYLAKPLLEPEPSATKAGEPGVGRRAPTPVVPPATIPPPPAEAAPAAPVRFTPEQVEAALDEADGDYLDAARALAEDDALMSVLNAANQARRVSGRFNQAMGARPRTGAMLKAEIEARDQQERGGFDPDNDDDLIRFVRRRGGITPSPTGDLQGEWEALPPGLRSRTRGLTPSAMAEALNAELGRGEEVINDAELLSRLSKAGVRGQHRQRQRAAERAREAEQQRLADEQRAFLDLPREAVAVDLFNGDDNALGRFIREVRDQAAEAGKVMEDRPEYGPEPRQQITPEKLRALEFARPSGGASMTPKAAFDLRERGEYETLADLATMEDPWRLEDALGRGYGSVPDTLRLAPSIKAGRSVRVYRAIETEEAKRIPGILPGAYVTESRAYATLHGRSSMGGRPFHIESMLLPPDELMVRGDPHEFVYLPKDAATAAARLAEPASAPRFERTPEGDQALVPGTPPRRVPETRTRARGAQKPVEETPLFGQEQERRQREDDERQGSLVEERPALPARAGKRTAPVRWEGWQERHRGDPLDLWTLTEDIPDHPVGSTLAGDTLRQEGYAVPDPPEEPDGTPFRYSSTEVRVPPGLADALRRFAQDIPRDQLAPKGVVASPHVTVRYGLHVRKPDRVIEALGAQAPFTIDLSAIGVFPDTPDGDVLYVRVESTDLSALHDLLTERLRTTETTEGYRPHVTLAYLKPGEGARYVGDRTFAGRSFEADSVIFEPKDGGEPTVIPLTGAFPEPPAVAQQEPALPGRLAGPAALRRGGPGLVRQPEPSYGAPTRTEGPPRFYSALRQAAATRLMPKSSRAQVVGVLRAAPGVKAAELHWTGLEGWVAQQAEPIPKQAVLDYLQAHEVRIAVRELSEAGAPEAPEEYDWDNRTWTGGPTEYEDREADDDIEPEERYDHPSGYRIYGNGTWRGWTVLDDQGLEIGSTATNFDRAIDLAARHYTNETAGDRDAAEASGPRHGERVEPGGEPGTYRERLYVWPAETLERHRPIGELLGGQAATPERVETLDRRLDELGATKYEPPSVHFPDAPNTFAHGRYINGRLVTGEPVLRAEEWQSDWRHAVLDMGERAPGPPPVLTELPEGYTVEQRPRSERTRATQGRVWIVLQPDGVEIARSPVSREEVVGAALQVVNADRHRTWEQAVPPFPFLKNWLEVVFKDAVMEAARTGKKWLVWTTGEQQNVRWNAGKVVAALQYADGELRAWPRARVAAATGPEERSLPAISEPLKPDQLKEWMGKALAERVLAANGEPVILDADERIGGEEHKVIYDQIAVNVARAFAKPWKARVEDVLVSARRAEDGVVGGDLRIVQNAVNGFWQVVSPDGRVYEEAETREAAKARLNEMRGGRPMHGLQITDEMVASIEQSGLPLFQPEPGYGPAGPRPATASLYETLKPPAPDAASQEAIRLAAKEIADGYPIRGTEDEALARGMGEIAVTVALQEAHGARSLVAGARQLGFDFGGGPGLRPGAVPVLATRPAARPGAARKGVVLHGLAIPAEIERGVVNLGAQPLGPDPLRHLAVLTQPLRLPLWETLRLIATKGDEVVGHRATTSRLSGSANAFEVGYEHDHAAYVEVLRKWLDDLGADGFYVMHNHPGGDPSPSAPDLLLTAMYAAHLPGFRGHVIINSEKYATILAPINVHRRQRTVDEPYEQRNRVSYLNTPTGLQVLSRLGDEVVGLTLQGWQIAGTGPPTRQASAEPAVHALPEAPDPYLAPGLPHELLRQWVYQPDAVAQLGKRVEREAPGQVVLFYASQGWIRAIETMDASRFADLAKASAVIQAGMRQYGASGVLGYAPWTLGENVVAAALDLVNDGVLMDHVVGGHRGKFDDSLRNLLAARGVAEAPPFIRAAINAGAERVEAPEPPYGAPPAGEPPESEATQEPRLEPRFRGGRRFAGNLGLDKYDLPEQVQDLVDRIERQHHDEFARQARGVVPDVEVARLARELGVPVDDLIRLRPGVAWSTEKILATRYVLAESATQLDALRERSSAPNASVADIGRFTGHFRRHVAIQQALAGLTAEAGRALRQFRQRVGPGQASLEDWNRLIEQFGGPKAAAEAAELLGRLPPDRLDALNAFTKSATKLGAGSMLYEYWINSLLSGPHTHVVNIFSNFVFAAERSFIERALAAGIDMVRARFTGTGRERYLGEVLAEAYALPHALREAQEAFAEAWGSESTAFGRAPEPYMERPHAIPGLAGRVIRAPTRALMAEDEFFKFLAYRMALHAEAYRAAAREGLDGRARMARAQVIAADPSPALIEAAELEAHVRTFTDTPPEWVQVLLRARDKIPGLRWVIPFIKTPSRLLNAAYERTPLYMIGLAAHELRYRREMARALRALGVPGAQLPLEAAAGAGGGGGEGRPPEPPRGGATPDEPLDPDALRRAAEAMVKTKPIRGGQLSDATAKVALGTMVMAATVLLVESGIITGGGPSDPGEKRAWLKNNAPYSFQIGGWRWGYKRVEPLGTVMAMTADLIESLGERVRKGRAGLGARALNALNEVILDKSWLTGMRDWARALADPWRYGQQAVQGFAGSFVPGLVGQVSRAVDPAARRAESVGEAMLARTPLSRTLYPRRDIWGRPVTLALAERASKLLLPFDVLYDPEDATAAELVRLHVGIRTPGRFVGGLELKDDEYDRYQERAGSLAKESLDKLFSRDRYRKLRDDWKVEDIRKEVSGARARARDEVLRSIGRTDERRRRQERSREKLHPDVLRRLDETPAPVSTEPQGR